MKIAVEWALPSCFTVRAITFIIPIFRQQQKLEEFGELMLFSVATF